MNFHLFDWLIPAEGESEVRTYHCTTLKSRLLSLKAEGYLVVSNKRVVFHAFGSTFSGDSILQSEVPIEDVSGITCYSGVYFSIWHFLGALFGSLIVALVINSLILGTIMRVVIDNVSFTNYDGYLTGIKVFMWILALGCVALTFLIPKDRIYRSFLAGLAVLFFAELGGLGYLEGLLGFILPGRSGGGEWIMILALIALIYAGFCMFWYSRRPTMSLIIGSKGGASTPIYISGVRSFGAGGGATRALSAEPAEGVEAMIQQLGAMVIDIQTLGDFGIAKWRVT